MGVRGLLKFLRTNPSTRVNTSLAIIAEEKRQECGKTATIICDFFGVLIWLLKLFHEAKVKDKSYSNESYLFGGDYVDYSDRFIGFLKALQYCCAEPILFIDGARGSSIEDLEMKMLTFEQRDKDQLPFVKKCVRYCKYDGRVDPARVRKWKKYPLIMDHVIMAVQRELPDVQIVHCDSEADSEMADYARAHSEVCGILSTDTDMVMMRKCEIIHCKFFDREDILNLRLPNFNEKPKDIICEIITPESLARVLKISIEDLKIVSIICGNDYTKSYQIYEQLNLEYPLVKSASDWIIKINQDNPHVSRCFFAIPFFKKILADFPDFFNAIQHTYKAYGELDAFSAMCKSTSTFSANIPRNHPSVPYQELSVYLEVVHIVNAGIKSGVILPRLSSIARNGIYWPNKYIEGRASKDKKTFVCAQELTLGLRKIIYMLLGLRKVREYGNFTNFTAKMSDAVNYSDFEIQFDCSSILLGIRDMPDINRALHLVYYIVKAKSLDNLDCLPCAANLDDYHPHIESQLSPILLCASLLHALSLEGDSSTSDNVEIAKDVFLATCLMSVYGDPVPNVFERPTVNAMNMNTELSCILGHAYEIASLFNLLEHLVPSGYCYKSATLVAFHQVAVASEASVKQKLKANPKFVSLHTTYTRIVGSRTFQELKRVLNDFHQKCNQNRLEAMDLVCMARAFYQCLGQYHDTLPDLEEEIHDLQAKMITSKSLKEKLKTSIKHSRKKSKHLEKPFMEYMQNIERDMEELQAHSSMAVTTEHTQTPAVEQSIDLHVQL